MAKKAPTFDEWLNQLGDSTAGVMVRKMGSSDQRSAYQAFQSSYTKHPDLVAASTDAVSTVLDAHDRAAAAAKAAAQPKSGQPAGQAPTAAAGVAPSSSPSVQNARSDNFSLAQLTQGPNSAAASGSSLFASSGLDLTTPIPGTIRGHSSLGLTGRADFSGPMSELPVTQTADQWLTNLYKMSPEELKGLQTQMFQAGWYDPASVKKVDQIPMGRVDPETIKAYESVMLETARYNSAGQAQTINQTLTSGAPSAAKAAAGLKSPSMAIANPIDVMNAARSAAATTIGGGMSTAEQQQFTASYAGQEQSAYQRYAQAGEDRAAGLGGAYVGAPAPDAAAKQYILANNPQDVVNYDTALRTVQFHNALGEL